MLYAHNNFMFSVGTKKMTPQTLRPAPPLTVQSKPRRMGELALTVWGDQDDPGRLLILIVATYFPSDRDEHAMKLASWQLRRWGRGAVRA